MYSLTSMSFFTIQELLENPSSQRFYFQPSLWKNLKEQKNELFGNPRTQVLNCSSTVGDLFPHFLCIMHHLQTSKRRTENSIKKPADTRSLLRKAILFDHIKPPFITSSYFISDFTDDFGCSV